MKMWTQVNRRRGRKNQTNISRRIKGNTTHTEAKMCICQTRSALSFLSICLPSPPNLPSTLFVFVFVFSHSHLISFAFAFSFSCIATYLYKRKKGTIGKSVCYTPQCPWSPSIRGIITPTFICNCFLISVRLHFLQPIIFSQTKLDDFPYQFCSLLFAPRSLSAGQFGNVFITIPNVYKYQPLMNYTHQNKEKEKKLFVIQWNTSTCTHARKLA